MKKLSASIDFTSSGDSSVFLEVAVQSVPVLCGHWTFNIRLGKKLLQHAGEWTLLCEHTEKGCGYTEIELKLADEDATHTYRLQRSVLLDKKNKVLLLLDTVLTDTESTDAGRPNQSILSYSSSLCVSSALSAKPSDEASEILFRPVTRPVAARQGASPLNVFPLALPEWKESVQSGIVHGNLTEKDGILTLHQETTGRSLVAPLFLDLNADRLNKPASRNKYTWRQLSVGENLQRVNEDQAVGYRVQIGKDQFLIYRSLTPLANRTLLGHNLTSDFCFARFDSETGVTPLIEIDVAP